MSDFEGWTADGREPTSPANGSVSYRNHNPGNLRSSPFALGTRDNFAYFLNDDVGLFALMWDIWMKAQGRTSTGLSGESTLSEFIQVYAPDGSDIVNSYVDHITSRTGLRSDTKLREIIQ